MPFAGATTVDLTSAIVRDPAPALSARVPPALRRIIERCLAETPGERYQQANEVRAALENVLADPQAPSEAGSLWTGRRWLAAGAAAIVALVAGALAFDVGGIRSRWQGAVPPGRIDRWLCCRSRTSRAIRIRNSSRTA